MTVVQLCKEAKVTRQGCDKATKKRESKAVNEVLILKLVCEIRARHPRMGARKMLHKITPRLIADGVSIGRDRFIELLRAHGLLIPRGRRRAPRTTNSRHRFRKYPNLLKGLVLTGPHQVWVVDLTYVDTLEGFLYVSLITDAFSRKVVGYEAHDTLEAVGCMRALRQALRQLPPGAAPVHHSDRGVQYCCGRYVEQLESRGLTVSMTEDNHCYENAKAERMNGILKHEYSLRMKFSTKAQARACLKQGVMLYNEDRPHLSLGYRTPSEVHAQGAAKGVA